jgi:hypothetical protein
LAIGAATVAARAAWNGRATIARRAAPPLAMAALACLALALAIYPASVALAAVVAGVLALARRRPAAGFAVAVMLFGFEGSVKILLGLESTPLPGGNRAAGAAALDLMLFGSLAAVLWRDRLRAPRAVWAAVTGAERIGIGVIGAWLALSLLQIAQGGDLGRGLHGFRLFQAYTLVALGSLTVFAQPGMRAVATRVALGMGLIVSLYAAVRVAIGPSEAERAYALALPTTTQYGDKVRAIGSFTSAVGLSSFMTPLATFALVLGLLKPGLRRLAWAVGVLALIAVIGSYSRAALLGVAFGLACSVLVVFLAADLPRRRKLASGAVALAVGVGAYGGLLVASHASPQLRERARGVLNPFDDESMRLRVATWRRNFEDALRHPVGEGVGAVGAASSLDSGKVRTADNSFLKILVEQGVLGLALFAAGMGAAALLLARRLRHAAAESRALGLAALAGFVSFLGLSLAGESVEQPGKVVAWGLLGIAAAVAVRSAAAEEPG